jgi:dimethylhistidine N-methyltransferase
MNLIFKLAGLDAEERAGLDFDCHADSVKIRDNDSKNRQNCCDHGLKRFRPATLLPRMMPSSPSPNLQLPDFIPARDAVSAAVRAELSAGLLANQAHISPKYLYDALGSKLFEAICELPEYYPTRTEAAICDAHLFDIADSVGRGATLIDLGAGNCAKAARLFPALQPKQYVAIDISADFLRDTVARLRQRFPDIDMIDVAQDFSHALGLPDTVRSEQRLFFYPGSSIGNFTPDEAVAFLRRLRALCHPGGDLLIGVDLVKDKEVLDAAYDDALGVTASFNLNILRHLNTLLQANFNLRDWQHRAFFSPGQSRIEMHLEARRDLRVSWSGGERRFREGERIHTENSYKYTQQGFVRLLEQAGFQQRRTWSDDRAWFMVCHARAAS